MRGRMDGVRSSRPRARRRIRQARADGAIGRIEPAALTCGLSASSFPGDDRHDRRHRPANREARTASSPHVEHKGAWANSCPRPQAALRLPFAQLRRAITEDGSKPAALPPNATSRRNMACRASPFIRPSPNWRKADLLTRANRVPATVAARISRLLPDQLLFEEMAARVKWRAVPDLRAAGTSLREAMQLNCCQAPVMRFTACGSPTTWRQVLDYPRLLPQRRR